MAAIDDTLDAAERAGLETIIYTNNPHQCSAAAALEPDDIAIEPPELIGTETSVSQADLDLVEKAVNATVAINESVDVFCGAGISDGEDLAAAKELGATGVLVASGNCKG